jgi:hypothetical protein
VTPWPPPQSYYERLSAMADEPKDAPAKGSPVKASKASKGKAAAGAVSKPPLPGAAAASLEVESLRGELAARDEALATMAEELSALR